MLTKGTFQQYLVVDAKHHHFKQYFITKHIIHQSPSSIHHQQFLKKTFQIPRLVFDSPLMPTQTIMHHVAPTTCYPHISLQQLATPLTFVARIMLLRNSGLIFLNWSLVILFSNLLHELIFVSFVLLISILWLFTKFFILVLLFEIHILSFLLFYCLFFILAFLASCGLLFFFL